MLSQALTKLLNTIEEIDIILAGGSYQKTAIAAADALRHSWTDVLGEGGIVFSLVSFFDPVLISKG